uniref:Spike protein n=2 Tax=Infectious bronchitis virus TaxID=11120 RepID=A0A3G6IPR3_9GAMC|nr:spike protein [Infectious bronchitis virus]
MLGKSLFLVTILFALCSADPFANNNSVVYYYQSQFRPSNGWHMHGGAYKVLSSFVNYTQEGGTKCVLGSINYGHHFNKSAVAITAPLGGMSWSAKGLCTVYCNFSDVTVFITHCTGAGNPCTLTGDLGIGNIRVSAMVSGKLVFNYTLTTAKHPKFKSLHCVNNYTSVYLNRDLVYTSNITVDVGAAGAYFKAGGPVTYKIMQEFEVLAYFQNGTVHDVILCDNSPKGLLACQYNTGNFSDGFYPFTNSTPSREKFFVYRENNVTTQLVLHNVSFHNESGASPNMGGVNTILVYQTHTAQDGYYNYNFSFLSQFVYKESNFMYGSYHPKCSFRPENINNGLWFNSLSISIGYGPIQGGCKQSVFNNKATCCYAYSYGGPISCKGVYSGELNSYFECGLLVFISKTDGSRIQTSNTVPTFTHFNYNNITLNKCVDYNIYGRTGVGFITNVTDAASSYNYLADSGLAVLDTSGAIDVFSVQGDYGVNYFKINPCEDVNQQFVVSGNNLVGYLTSVNVSGSQLLSNQYFVKYGTTHRGKRSTSSSPSNVTSCPYISYGQHCIYPNGSVHLIVPGMFAGVATPLLNFTESVLIPDSFNLTVTDEYIQTRMDAVQINCIQYVCGTSVQCRSLFQQYGSVCDTILSIVNSLNQKDSEEVLALYSLTQAEQPHTPVFSNFSTGEFNISVLLPSVNGGAQGRSFIEDLLFTKVESVGLPTDTAYQKCTEGPLGTVKDLVCAQYYNGIMVLPPVITGEMQAMYTGSLVASMMFGGITAAGAIPFATQVQARINHLGITQTILLKNQETLANSFNKAVRHMQEGFSATSQALVQIQDVINQQSAILSEVMAALNKNFGAISSVIQDIYKQLDALAANAQVDRLITGRLSALSVLASSKQSEYSRVAYQRQLAQQKVNECVRSQSSRNSFCGLGKHVLSIPQSAPNGIVFVHFTYTPQTYVNVTAIVGFCINSSYALVPVTDRGIFIQLNGSYYITSRDMYMPRNITSGDVVVLTSCQANYVSVNKTVVSTFVDESDFDFEDELSKWWNETEHKIPNFEEFNYTVPILNISSEIDRISDAIIGLNQSVVDLEKLSILTTYIKWPWYVWLAIGFAIIIFILILGWVFFMTGCCGCCCECFGIIPLMNKCGKKSSYYTTFDNDVVTEQYRPKKSV